MISSPSEDQQLESTVDGRLRRLAGGAAQEGTLEQCCELALIRVRLTAEISRGHNYVSVSGPVATSFSGTPCWWRSVTIVRRKLCGVAHGCPAARSTSFSAFELLD
jgi:hypothetical protein